MFGIAEIYGKTNNKDLVNFLTTNSRMPKTLCLSTWTKILV